MNWLLIPLCLYAFFNFWNTIDFKRVLIRDVDLNYRQLRKMRKENKAMKAQLEKVLKLLEEKQQIGFKK